MGSAAMFWSLFVYVVILPGFPLALLFLCAKAPAFIAGTMVLATPIRIGGVQFSLATFVTALCAVLTALSFSAFRRHQQIVAGAKLLEVQQERDLFRAERNFWLSLLGFSLWACTWRLKALA